MTVTVRHTPISWRRLGSVIDDELPDRRRRRPGAPPRRARGRSWLIPVEQQDRAEPEQDPGADEPDGGERAVEVTQPRPREPAEADGDSSWLTRPVDDSSHVQTMPAATRGITWGRNSTVRDTAPSRAGGDAPDQDATTSPSTTGTKLKKTMSSNALHDRSAEVVDR